MTKVFIANCTMQNQIANFRLPEFPKPHSIQIPMGRQVEVGDLTPPQLDSFVEQMGRYGMVHADEAGKTGPKVSLLYSTKGPIPQQAFLRVIERNKGILRVEGVKRRQEAAIAANSAMNTEETPVQKLEMSIEEDTPGSFGGQDDPIEEGIRIDNDAVTSENKPPRRRGGNR